MADDTVHQSADVDQQNTFAHTTLKANAIGLPGVLMTGVTNIAPAIAGLFTIPFIALNAGISAPLAYLGAFIIALMLGTVLAQLTKHITSAGTYYTFVSRTLGGQLGFLVGWVYLLFYPIVVAQVGSFMGDTLHGVLLARYNINFPWWIFMIFLILFVFYTSWRGIELSSKLVIVLGCFEIGVCVLLALFGLFDPGKGGTSLSWLSPAHAPSAHGFFLAIVFAIFAINGWDACACLGEESRDPKRIIPRGVLGSIALLGFFLVLVSWGQISGWGTANITGFINSPQLPALVLGQKYWGWGWWFVLLALLNSALAVSIVCQNVSARIFFALGRSGSFSHHLAKVHPKYKTPTNAIWLQSSINVVLGLLLPVAIGVANVYNVTGTMFTFAAIPVYCAANVGVFILYRRMHRDEFNVLYHLIFPLVSSIALIVVGYESLRPLPAWPIVLAAPIVAVWLLIGIIVLVSMLRSGRKAWLKKAGQAMANLPDSATST